MNIWPITRAHDAISPLLSFRMCAVLIAGRRRGSETAGIRFLSLYKGSAEPFSHLSWSLLGKYLS